MKCPKCNSENVQVQAKEFKPKVIGVSCLTFGGFGGVFLGIIGAFIGAGIGAIVGIILNSVMSNTYQSVMVCQNCGYVSQPMNQPMTQPDNGTLSHPLFSDPEESNLDVIRNDVVKGTIVIIRVKIDNYAPFDVANNSTTCLKVDEGVHTISYEQINGIGRKKNRGQLNITVDEKKSITISFTRQGLIVR